MNTHHVDILLLPDPEFPPHQLLAALYAKLHRALVQFDSRQIAACFPRQDTKGLGSVLRLIGPAKELDALMASNWLQGMRDHADVAPIQAVPEHHQHRSLRRVQAKSSPDRFRRRQMKRHGLTYEEACARVPDHKAQLLDLPFIHLSSSSTGQSFRLYLRLSDDLPTAIPGEFNAYGLSQTATLPWF